MIKHPWRRHFKSYAPKDSKKKIHSTKTHPELRNIIFGRTHRSFAASNSPRCCEIHLQFINDPCSRRRRMIRNPHSPWNLTSNDRQHHILCQHRMHQGAKNQPHGHHGSKVQTMARTSVPRVSLELNLERWICGPPHKLETTKTFRHQKGWKTWWKPSMCNKFWWRSCNENSSICSHCEKLWNVSMKNVPKMRGCNDAWHFWRGKSHDFITSKVATGCDESPSLIDHRMGRIGWTQTKHGVWRLVL